VLLTEARDVIQYLVGGGDKGRGESWLQRSSGGVPMCECIAHSNAEFFNDIGASLIEVYPPLTDDSGYRLASTLIPFILKGSKMANLSFESARQGPVTAVRYMLELPSGDTSLFTGRPDFHIRQNFSFVERRLGKPMKREHRVRGVGEIQSPPGTSPKAKSAALAQAAIGQLTKLPETSQQTKIATVVLYKDFTAQVAIATLDPAGASSVT